MVPSLFHPPLTLTGQNSCLKENRIQNKEKKYQWTKTWFSSIFYFIGLFVANVQNIPKIHYQLNSFLCSTIKKKRRKNPDRQIHKTYEKTSKQTLPTKKLDGVLMHWEVVGGFNLMVNTTKSI